MHATTRMQVKEEGNASPSKELQMLKHAHKFSLFLYRMKESTRSRTMQSAGLAVPAWQPTSQVRCWVPALRANKLCTDQSLQNELLVIYLSSRPSCLPPL
jgi:hypothetical protein